MHPPLALAEENKGAKGVQMGDSEPTSARMSAADADEDVGSSSEGEDSNEDLDYYYSFQDEDAEADSRSGQLNNNEDPEFFAFECLSQSEAEALLTEDVKAVVDATKASASEAKLLLLRNQWSVSHVVQNWKTVARVPPMPLSALSGPFYCEVCATCQPAEKASHLPCQHRFCDTCWELHFECQINQGLSTSLSCMWTRCDMPASEEFVLRHLRRQEIREKYLSAAFRECVRAHPLLKFCPGRSCKVVVRAAKPLAKRCICVSCTSAFCFLCGGDYHAPTDCETIKRWLTKCADDSETANYISAHTKDCPKCAICIEKNGGCNHMQCYSCKHDFCWMCLGDWKTHGSEYYECSRYKENPNIAHESIHAQAREALKKYLHYFERWENHSKSMKLEAHTREKIKNRITEKVMAGSGTWIDWQYLLDASSLLAKCRYTLQYTYPYAYYMEPCPRKELFEYQQAQLEAEIENLSWKIEHAETTDRGDLENQIDIAEKKEN